MKKEIPGIYKSGKQLAKNTILNYANLICQLIAAIFITRMMFLNLGKDYYGFWQLLWMVFGYSLLLDFGFGISIQKYTGEYTVTGDIGLFNKLVSSAVGTYAFMTLVIISLTLLITPFIDSIFSFGSNITVENLKYYKTVFMTFGIGTAIVFPMGIFAEILHGIGRLDLKMSIQIFNVILQFTGIYIILDNELSLLTLTLFTVILNFSTNIIMCIIVFKKIPGLQILFKHFHFSKIKKIASFSIFAYLTIFSKLVIFKTDQIVLGVMLGMSSIAIYHVGSRLAKILSDFSTRFQENLAPLAAALYKSGDKEKLKWILFKSNRISAYITTGVFLVLIVLMKPILFFWLKITDSDDGVYIIAYLMLISIYILTLFRSASDKFMLMAGQHKKLAGIAIFEAIVNLILSVIFIKLWGIVGVAWGTFIPNLLISLFFFFPFMCSFGGFKKRYFFVKIYFPIFMISIPTVFVLWAMTEFIFPISNLLIWGGWEGFFKLGLCSSVGGILYLMAGALFLLSKDEKSKILDRILKKNQI